MRSIRTRLLSLTALAILLMPMLGMNSSISLADHLVPTGVVVPLQMNTSLSSNTAHVGQQWTATVVNDVYAGNQLVIPRGSTVEGVVSSVDDADRFNKSGKIGIDFQRVIFPNGSRLENIDAMLTSLDPRLRSSIDEESRIHGGGSSFKRNIYFIGGGTGGGALIGAIAGGGSGAAIGAGAGAVIGLIGSALNKGREVEIPVGTQFGMELLNQVEVPVAYLQQYPNRNYSPPSSSNYPSSSYTTRTTQTYSTSIVDLNSRAAISEMQKKLRTGGFYRGPITGTLSWSTRQALKNYQTENDLAATGQLDTRTAEALGLISTTTPDYGNGNVALNIDPNGQPSYMGVGSTHRFIIWRDGNSWKIRTTTAGLEHRFEGRIIANGGTINSVSQTGLENVDQLALENNRRTINFDFTTAGAMDGINFSTNADTVTFEVEMDGRSTARNVFIGRNGENPVSIPFTLENE